MVLVGSDPEYHCDTDAAVTGQGHLAEPTVPEASFDRLPDAGEHRRRSGPDPDATLKQLAKALARDATARITDRHLRALVRTDCYNLTVALLRDIDRRRQSLLERQRRTRRVLGATALALAAALGISLML